MRYHPHTVPTLFVTPRIGQYVGQSGQVLCSHRRSPLADMGRFYVPISTRGSNEAPILSPVLSVVMPFPAFGSGFSQFAGHDSP